MAFDNGYALVIGVGSYVHIPYANIPISVTDAEAVRDLLCNPDLCGYLPEQVTFLHNGTASRGGILSALDVLAGKITSENTVLLYYCGHGDYGTDGNYYLTTHDTEVSDGRVAKGTGISEAELLDKLRVIAAKRLLLLFNLCHSGEISPDLGIGDQEKSFGNTSLPEAATEALLATGEGRILITACRPEQKSWIGSGKLSIYTQALVDGLSGKGYVSNNNGYVSAFALYEHMYFSVKEAAGKLGKTQEPELTVLRGVGPFPVSLYRGATSLGVFAPEESVPDGTSTREVDPARSERLFRISVRQVEARGERNIVVQGDVSNSSFETGNKTNINTDGGAYIAGGVQVAGGDFAGRDQHKTVGLSGSDVAALFKPIYAAIEARPDTPAEDKGDIKADVEEIQAEVAKGDKADEGFLARRLRNLKRMAPDILEVVLATLANPAVGLGTVASLLAKRMQTQAEGREI